ncbi:arsenite efflux MFS transporter ArsK [Devosia sp.]|uniref:arsenite efflux MFS transporter ArsK n=1 Tax=Devosia sp. TaxID=1871048 RepID=UPI003F6F6447
MSSRGSAAMIWALGATQVIGYGTLYYAFSVLAPAIGAEFGWPPEWVFGALSLALLAGGLLAPWAGHLADRFGAARTMVVGSVAAALLLGAAGLAWDGCSFALALVGMEMASSLVLYATAFAALVQAGAEGAQRRITYLTLIAGFASTLFWPLTTVLLEHLGWRGCYFVFAALNLVVCAPLHFWLARRAPVAVGEAAGTSPHAVVEAGVLPTGRRNLALGLMMAGFAIEGLVLSGVLLQIMPIIQGLSLGAGALVITTLFGPAQVLSRLVNMLVGRDLKATWLAVIAASLLPAGLAVLLATAPSLSGAVVFAVLFGLGSGLTSIVSGALPLYLLGRDRYGARLGWLSSARQVASAIAPFLLAVAMGALGVGGALWVFVALGLVAVSVFVAVEALVPRRAVIVSQQQGG